MTYRVVVGVDGSAHGDAALRWALAQAESRGGQVTAVFAWQQPFVSIPGAFDREELEQAAKDFLVEKVSAVAPSPKVPLLPLVAEGDPAEALVVAANGADLLVVGTRGRSPFMGGVLGAVSLRCAAGASCPVTLVKLAGDHPQGQAPPSPAGRPSALSAGVPLPAPGVSRRRGREPRRSCPPRRPACPRGSAARGRISARRRPDSAGSAARRRRRSRPRAQA